MTIRGVSILGATVVLVATGGCSGYPQYVSEDGAFAVQFPCSVGPRYLGSIPVPQGEVPSHFVECADEAGAFSVAFGDLPAEILRSNTVDQLLSSALAVGRVERAKAREVSREQISASGYPGVSARFVLGNDEETEVIRHVYLVESRIYTLSATLNSARKRPTVAKHFFASFVLR